MTYMGNPYYPQWLDNLAGDVTLEAAAMDGIASGADDVRSIVVAARQFYDHQEFSYAGPCGMPTYVVVLVSFNAVGQTQTASLIANPAGYHHNVIQTMTLNAA